MSLITGFLSLLFFMAGITFSILKASKLYSIKRIAKKSHCFIGFFAVAIGIFHSLLSSLSIKFTFGYLSLLLLLIITVFGILTKYSKSSLTKRNIHIVVSILTLVVILLHIYSKLLF
ncbi:hypothetical protein CLHUN_22090 [Ruminiclostridium hungatei]|uniref:Uncharacterized protein n=1 Tax=Ruminiclostridium hungatei TaxID=48256 RepID=A0A1V4SKD1_RUMHU|nr:hypothetical protein CLHUN_22090 [Ruminiclostridium hungatei]